MKRFIAKALPVLILFGVACERTPTLSFGLLLVSCSTQPASNQAPTFGLLSIEQITNLTDSAVQYDLPVQIGYRVLDQSGAVLDEQLASYVSPAGCDTGCSVTLAPNSSQYFVDSRLLWDGTVPVDPSDIGNPGAPRQPVPPGTYRIQALFKGYSPAQDIGKPPQFLNDGDETNLATVVVCAGPSASDPNSGVCISPCASQDVADKLVAGAPVVCGDTLSCGSY